MNSQSNEASFELNMDLLTRNQEFVDRLDENFDSAEDFLNKLDFSTMIQPSSSELITVLAQPQCPSRLRYSNAYGEKSRRRDALKGSLPIYTGPAIRIQQQYLDNNRDKYIGVTLSTVKHEKTNSLYIHPYILENIDNKKQNDIENRIVWYPLQNLTQENVLTFPDLRIVRVKEDELENAGSMRILYDFNLPETLLNSRRPIEVTKRQIKPEYNLTKGLLAFFIGEKLTPVDQNQFPTIIPGMNIFLSNEFDMKSEDGTNDDTESVASPLTPTDCSIYKYAPLFGFTEGDNEMIVICTKNLNKRQYGDVKIRFQSNIEIVNELKFESIKIVGNILYFKMPSLPLSINGTLDVKIKIQQTNRDLGVIDYQYLKQNECHTCQMNKIKSANLLARSDSNKRPRNSLYTSDTDFDGIVPTSEHDHTPTLQHSKSEQSANQSSLSYVNQTNETLKRLEENTCQLFENNDLKPILRSCRLFIKERPELFHQAIEKNYSDLITSFVSVAGPQLLESKNDQGETPFLQGIRLNRVNFIRAFLQRENVNQFLYNVNYRQQNIFHLLAMSNDSDDLFQLIIDYLLKNSIDIKERFDCIDSDNYTPLQVAILNQNLAAVRHLIKYSEKEIVQTSSTLGENLIHFTVRNGNLKILKYFLENEDLIEQGNRSSLTMTPFELANSLKHDDMKEYLEKIYPQPKIECQEETSESD